MSKILKVAEDFKELLSDQADPDVILDEHPGSENYMDVKNAHMIHEASGKLIELLNEKDDLPQWVSHKLSIAKEMIDTAYEYVYHRKSHPEYNN